MLENTERGNQKWTIQGNWRHRVHKTKKNTAKTQHNMCWTPLYENKHKSSLKKDIKGSWDDKHTSIGFLIEEIIIRRNGPKNMNFSNACRFNKSQTSQSREWVSDCCLTPTQQFFSYIWRERVNFQLDDDEVRFVLDQHAYFDFYSASSLQQLSTNKQVATLSHIILIPSLCSFSLMLHA
jgi:hypothetical protein